MGVPKHPLNILQARTLREPMGGKGMTERVRRDRRADARLRDILLQDEPDALPCQCLPARVDEQGSLLGRSAIAAARTRQVIVQSVLRTRAERDAPFVLALANS